MRNIQAQQLLFQAWHFDRVVLTNPPIGEILIDLEKYDLEKPTEEWHRFKEVDTDKFRFVAAIHYSMSPLLHVFTYVKGGVKGSCAPLPTRPGRYCYSVLLKSSLSRLSPTLSPSDQ